MKAVFTCVLTFCCLNVALSQPGRPRPDFDSYRVRHIYRGRPAAPIFSKVQPSFRSRIRDTARANVQFAGHYTIPSWSCGEACIHYAIVDSVTGRVYDMENVVSLPLRWTAEYKPPSTDPIQFHPDSGLLKINGCPEGRSCGLYDYVVVGHDKEFLKLKLVYLELLPEEYQPEQRMPAVVRRCASYCRVRISATVMSCYLLNRVEPVFPAGARNRKGRLTLQLLIGRDGSVIEAEKIRGPAPLVGAGVEAVAKWKYRPYILNGEPVEVDTTVDFPAEQSSCVGVVFESLFVPGPPPAWIFNTRPVIPVLAASEGDK